MFYNIFCNMLNINTMPGMKPGISVKTCYVPFQLKTKCMLRR